MTMRPPDEQEETRDPTSTSNGLFGENRNAETTTDGSCPWRFSRDRLRCSSRIFKARVACHCHDSDTVGKAKSRTRNEPDKLLELNLEITDEAQIHAMVAGLSEIKIDVLFVNAGIGRGQAIE